MIGIFRLIFLLALVSSCDGETNFSSKTDAKSEAVDTNNAMIPSSEKESSPGPKSGFVSEPKTVQTLDLSISTVKEQAKTDYLLVVDNSSSMGPFLAAINTGFESLSSADVSGNHRIAAISTMVEDYANPGQLYPGLSKTYFALEQEPGFLSLKNRASILAFRSELEAAAIPATITNARKEALLNNFSNLGCDDSWIKINDKNTEGESCLKALLQIGNTGVGCEAGINAFSQFIGKMASTPNFFRSDAALNVIFVSDEAYPGCSNADLQAKCETATDLKNKIKSAWGIDNVVFNGIVTDEEMASTKTCSYKTLAADSGGALVKMDDPEKYKDAILQILDTVKPEDTLTHVFEKDVEIKKITIDGTAHKNYALNGHKLVIKHLGSFPLTAKIKVEFIEENSGSEP